MPNVPNVLQRIGGFEASLYIVGQTVGNISAFLQMEVKMMIYFSVM